MSQFFSVKTAPMQKLIHLLIFTQIKFLMKLIILYGQDFNWYQYLTNSNLPFPQVVNAGLHFSQHQT